MRQIEFVVTGKPEPKARPRFARIGTAIRSYTPAKTVAYEKSVALAARVAMSGAEPFSGPVMLQVAIHLPVPSSWSKRRKGRAIVGEIAATKKPDADNVLKAIKDGMNGVVYRDDAQVFDIRLHKRYGTDPHVAIVAIETELESA